MADRCLSRLTNFFETQSVHIPGTRSRASIVAHCRGKPVPGEFQCESCLAKPETARYRDGKYHGRNVHGLLTEEPPPDSQIYGSPWYCALVVKKGEPPDEAWQQAAMEAQLAAEEWVKEVGFEPWLIKPPTEEQLVQMPPARKAKQPPPKPLPKEATILKTFPTIKRMYEEIAAQPVKLQTDTCEIWKDTVNVEGCEKEVFVTEFGHVFEINSIGKVGRLLGKLNTETNRLIVAACPKPQTVKENVYSALG